MDRIESFESNKKKKKKESAAKCFRSISKCQTTSCQKLPQLTAIDKINFPSGKHDFNEP